MSFHSTKAVLPNQHEVGYFVKLGGGMSFL